MRVLVFGRNGQVARALAAAEWPQGWSVATLGQAECDLATAGTAAAAIDAARPGIVINAAAYTAVDKAESDTETARRLNALAPEEMARAAARLGVPLIHISTDYVYEGRGRRAYVETDAHAPINAYGLTKAEGDEAIRREQPQHVILRTSWIFSAGGTNFVRTMLRLGETRDTLRVVGDQIGAPTAAADIARTIVHIAAGLADRSGPFGTYHYAGAPDTSWYRFAQAIFEGAERRGLAVPPRLIEIGTADYETAAERPLNSRLDCGAIQRDWGVPRPLWQHGLDQCLDVLLHANGVPVGGKRAVAQ